MLWFHILVSTVPAAIIGILFDDVFERLFYNFQTVAIMLILFGIAFIVIETRHNGKSAKINSLVDISYTTALMIGFFQLIAAVFPGTSRSGATIVGALLIGVSRTFPSHVIVPQSGVVSVHNILINVVFPAPLTPSNP